MRTFQDNAGRTWSVSVNIETARRLRTAGGVDLMELVERPLEKAAADSPPRRSLLERLIRDPILLCDVLYVVCKEEADRLAVSDADFGRSLYGAAISAARSALLEEIADFFPDEGPALRSQANKILAALKTLMAKVELRVKGTDENELVEAALAQIAAMERNALPPPTPGTSSTISPANAGSIPAG